jgi:hypothetical protein
MPTISFRILASEDDTQDVIHHVQYVNDVERAEEVADMLPHTYDSDSSSSGLSEDYGSCFHCVEVDAPNDDIAELVRVAAEERAMRLGAVIEFVDRF